LDGKAEYVSGDGGIGAGRWARSISRDRVATLAGQVLCPRVGVDLAIGGCALLMPPDVIAALRALRTNTVDAHRRSVQKLSAAWQKQPTRWPVRC